MLEHHAHGALPHLGRILLHFSLHRSCCFSCFSRHRSTFSCVGPSGKPGAVQSVILSANGSVTAHDGASGRQLWVHEGVRGNTIASATVSGNLVIAGSSERGATVALRLPSERDAAPQPIWRPANASASYGSALVHDGRVYTVNKAGVAFALDLDTGAELWNHRTGECWASPLAAAGHLYFFNIQGKTTVLRPGPEPIVASINELDEEHRLYGVAATGRSLLLSFATRLYCIADTPGHAG